VGAFDQLAAKALVAVPYDKARSHAEITSQRRMAETNRTLVLHMTDAECGAICSFGG
jgi:hypothetical protein